MDFTNKAVYISGAMTGYPDWNKPAFDKKEQELYDLGARFVFNPTKGAPSVEEAKVHSYYMLHDLHELTQSFAGEPIYDCIVMLPGWECSDGARVELIVANECGIEVVMA